MTTLSKKWQIGLPMSYKLLDGSMVQAHRSGSFIFVDVPDRLAGGFRAKYRFRFPRAEDISTFAKPVPSGLSPRPKTIKRAKPPIKQAPKNPKNDRKVVKKRKS